MMKNTAVKLSSRTLFESYRSNPSLEVAEVKGGWLINPAREFKQSGQLFSSYLGSKYDVATGKVSFQKTQVLPRGLRLEGEDKIVSRSLPTNIDVVLEDPQTLSNFDDIHKVSHSLDLSRCVISPQMDGVLIQIYKYDGEIHFSTSRRIDARRSQWGSDKTYLDLWIEARGVDPSEEFSELSEGVTLLYLLTAPEFAYIFGRETDKAETFFVGYEHFGESNEPILGTNLTPELTEAEAILHMDRGLKEMSEEALQYDKNLLPGGAVVIMEFRDKESKDSRDLSGLVNTFTVSPASCVWKDLLRDRVRGTRARLWHLTTISVRSDSEFYGMFPNVPVPDSPKDFAVYVRDITGEHPVELLVEYIAKKGTTRICEYDERNWIIFFSLLCSTPQQGWTELVNTYINLDRDYKALCSWMADVAKGKKDPFKPTKPLLNVVARLRKKEGLQSLGREDVDCLTGCMSGCDLYGILSCMERTRKRAQAQE